MAVKIRMSRFGTVSKPVYRVIAIDEHQKRDGRAVEIIGTYDPHKTSGKLIIKKDRLDYWLSVGAKPSDTLAQLLKK